MDIQALRLKKWGRVNTVSYKWVRQEGEKCGRNVPGGEGELNQRFRSGLDMKVI